MNSDLCFQSTKEATCSIPFWHSLTTFVVFMSSSSPTLPSFNDFYNSELTSVIPLLDYSQIFFFSRHLLLTNKTPSKSRGFLQSFPLCGWEELSCIHLLLEVFSPIIILVELQSSDDPYGLRSLVTHS